MNDDLENKKGLKNNSSNSSKDFESVDAGSGSAENNDDDKYKPSTDKFKAEQKALEDSLKPKDYSELVHKDPNLIDDIVELERREPKPLQSFDYNKKLPEKNSTTISNEDKINIQKPLNVPHESEVFDLNDSEDEDELSDEEINTIEKAREEAFKNPIRKFEEEKIKKVRMAVLEDEDTKMFCGLCHLCNLLVVTLAWVPFFIYLGKADNMKIKFQAVQSILFGLLAFGIVLFLGSIAFSAMSILCFGCLLLPVVALFALACWGYTVFVTVKCFKGENFRMPFIAELSDYIVRFLSK